MFASEETSPLDKPYFDLACAVRIICLFDERGRSARQVGQRVAPSEGSSEVRRPETQVLRRRARSQRTVKLRRFLRPDAIRLDLHTPAVPAGVLPEDFDPDGKRNINRVREGVARELTELFEATGAVSNPTKLFKELCDREKMAPTGVGNGIALPHLRTLQAKSFVMAFARSEEGLPFQAPDEEPVHLFFGMIAPPYDDRMYLRVYKSLATLLLDPEHLDNFLTATDDHQILRGMELI